ncbi:MFS transporter [Candidatus Sumerlaeota bacterium]|nr:MFS transporter [Candidatus Sumerlaeota bacterium]
MAQTSSEHHQTDQDEVRRHLKFNFMAHGIEGALFTGAMAFVDVNIVLPEIIRSLAGPEWLIASTPILMRLGILGPSIITSVWVERVKWLKPLLIVIGFFQRIPFLFAGLALLMLGQSSPLFCLVAVVLAFLLSGFVAGLTITGWQEFVCKTIPDVRRSSLWAFRSITAALMGLGAAWVVKKSLDAYPGMQGIGILHIIAFIFMMGSLAVFSAIRETDVPPQNTDPRPDLRRFWKTIAASVRTDKNLRFYLLSRLLTNSSLICLPFLSIHTLQTLNKPQDFLGVLLLMKTVGMIIGNFIGGWLGDRTGGKAAMLIGAGAWALTCFASGFAGAEWQFHLIFLLMGFAFALQWVSFFSLGTELAPKQKRIAYLTAISFTSLIGAIATVTLTAILKESGTEYSALAMLAGAGMVFVLLFITQINEPRKAAKTA